MYFFSSVSGAGTNFGQGAETGTKRKGLC